MKLFKAVLKPKKVIRDIHEEITLYSNEYKFKKDFIDHCIESMKGEGYNVDQWFAPVVEIASEEEFNTAMAEIEAKAEEVEDLDEIEAPEKTLNEFISDESTSYYHPPIKRPQILIKLVKSDYLDGVKVENFSPSYSVDGGLFIDIDGSFKDKTNAIDNALGHAIDTINEMKDCEEITEEDQKKAVAVITGRGPSFYRFWEIEPEEIKPMLDYSIHNFKKSEKKKEKYPEVMEAVLFAQMNSELEHLEPVLVCYEAMESAIDDVLEEVKHERKFIDWRLLSYTIQKARNFNLLARYISCVEIVRNSLIDNNDKPQKEEKPEPVKLETPAIQVEPVAPPAEKTEEPTPAPEKEKKETKAEIKAREKAEAEKAEEERREKIEEKEKERQADIKKQISEINETINALKSGEVIVLDNVPNEVYHGCGGISSSKVKDAIVSLYYYDQKHNKKEIERKENPNFDIGSLFHSLTLEPEITDNEFLNSGCETRAAKQFKSIKEDNPHLTVLTEDEYELAERLRHAVINDPESSRLIKHELRQSERSYFKRDEETGLIIKCRPDIELGAIVADLKSVGVRSGTNEAYTLNALRKDVQFLHYDLSAAMYLDITEKSSFVWIFANKEKGNHWTATTQAGEGTLERGHQKYREYLLKIADGIRTGEWPKPASIQSTVENGKIKLPIL